jgi:hypothetical protein
MGGERGIGSQQELVGETPEDVVIGVDDDKLRKVAAQRVAAVDASHQEAGHRSQAVTEISRPVGHAIDLAQVQAGLVEAEIENAARRSWSTGILRANSPGANSRR